MKKTIKYIGASLAIQLLPLLAMAQTPTAPEGFESTFTVDNLIAIIEQILVWVTIIVGILAVLFILYAAIMFIISAGNEERVNTAKKALLWGLVGIGVAILAYAAFSFMQSFIDAGSGGVGA